MSNKSLTLFFSGTDMTWEDMAVLFQLGAKRRHNLSDREASHYFYTFDGPAAAISNQHLPVENIQFDTSKVDYMRASPRKNMTDFGYRSRWIRGTGAENTACAAYDLMCYCIVNLGIRKIELDGFSRGGNIALLVAALMDPENDLKDELSLEEINKIEVNIIAADPVAGILQNKSVSAYGQLSKFIKTCVIGLATNESVPGFAPRDILSDTERYNVKFHPDTQYICLPMPDDHAMTTQWISDVIRRRLPSDSELVTSSCNEQYLIDRRLGLLPDEVKWIDRIDERRGYRLVHFCQHKEKYMRHILPINTKGQIEVLGSIECYFQSLNTQRAVTNIDHVSLQNDADIETTDRVYKGSKVGGVQLTTKSLQVKAAYWHHDRTCKIKIGQYTNSLFVNLHHEAMFAAAYPGLHQFLFLWDIKWLDLALDELFSMPEGDCLFTRYYIEDALLQGVKLLPLADFYSTNIKNYSDIFAVIGSGLRPSIEQLPVDKLSDCDEIRKEKLRVQLINLIEKHQELDLLPLKIKPESIRFFTKKDDRLAHIPTNNSNISLRK